MKGNELVLSVRKSNMPPEWTAQTAAIPAQWPRLSEILDPIQPLWIPRRDAESSTDFKQIIPYVLSQSQDRRFAVYPRKGSEARLHGLWSAAAGGHVDPTDASTPFQWRQTIEAGARRELQEEFLNLDSIPKLHPLGIVNEELSDVGKVHLGIAFLAIFQDNKLPTPAHELLGLQWQHEDSMTPPLKLELWSTLALDIFNSSPKDQNT